MVFWKKPNKDDDDDDDEKLLFVNDRLNKVIGIKASYLCFWNIRKREKITEISEKNDRFSIQRYSYLFFPLVRKKDAWKVARARIGTKKMMILFLCNFFRQSDLLNPVKFPWINEHHAFMNATSVVEPWHCSLAEQMNEPVDEKTSHLHRSDPNLPSIQLIRCRDKSNRFPTLNAGSRMLMTDEILHL